MACSASAVTTWSSSRYAKQPHASATLAHGIFFSSLLLLWPGSSLFMVWNAKKNDSVMKPNMANSTSTNHTVSHISSEKADIWQVWAVLILGSWFCNTCTGWSDQFYRVKMFFCHLQDVHSLIHQIFMEHLIHSRLYSKYWGYGIEQNILLLFTELISWVRQKIR